MKLRNSGGGAAAAVMLLACAALAGCLWKAGGDYVPLVSLPASRVVTGQGHMAARGQININTASAEELDTLPGIGAVKAGAIVNWREEHGPFRYPEELILVPGIGEGTLSGLLDRITTGE